MKSLMHDVAYSISSGCSVLTGLCDVCPQTYVPTVFENYTACLELEDQRVELSLWDTSGKSSLTAWHFFNDKEINSSWLTS